MTSAKGQYNVGTAPSDVATLRQLAVWLEMIARTDEAIAAWLKIGAILQARGHFEEARDAYLHVLAQQQDSVEGLVELGAVLLKLGQPDEAVRFLGTALTLDSENNSGHVLLSRAYHLLGDCARGLEEFTWLTHPSTVAWRGFAQPLWDGSRLDGRTILLWTRPGSGLGDAIQFLRYARLVKDHGGRVAFESQPQLVGLIRRMPWLDIVVAQGETLPSFEVHAPLPRLPTLLRDEPWPLPARVPYMSVDPGLVERWSERLGHDGRMNIGIVWSGDSRRPDASLRFTTLATFSELSRIADVSLVSLQFGPQADELVNLPPGLNVRYFPADDIGRVEDTAALIMNLDLVISVDTMFAHLAGALGKSVWTLLPFAADWRWLQGDSTPWYSVMRLFRQGEPSNWTGVMERVAHAVEMLATRICRDN